MTSLNLKWVGEELCCRLRDAPEDGFLGMARETELRLGQTQLRLTGRRLGGLREVIDLVHLLDVRPRPYPVLTLDIETRRGRIEVPASAHAVHELAALAEMIEEAAEKLKRAFRSPSGAAQDDLKKLTKLMGDTESDQ